MKIGNLFGKGIMVIRKIFMLPEQQNYLDVIG
jgi:hypothetical protein